MDKIVINTIMFVAVLAVVILGLPGLYGGSICDDKQLGMCVREWAKDLLVPAFGLAAAVFAARFTYVQMKAAQDQTAILAADQRPWITIELEYTKREMQWCPDDNRERPVALIRAKLKNIGNRPSTNSGLSFSNTTSVATLAIEQSFARQIASFKIDGPPVRGVTIFPGETFTVPGDYGIVFPDQPHQVAEWAASVSGVVHYQNSSAQTFYTPYGFNVVFTPIDGGPDFEVTFQKNGNVVPPV